MFEPRHGILKGGIAAICALLLVRLSTTSSPTRMFVVQTGSPRMDLLPGRLQLGVLPRSYTIEVGSRNAGASLVLGGASARRRSSGPRLASSGDADVPENPKTSESPKGESQDGLKGLLKQWKEDPEFQEDVKTFFTSLTIALAIRGFLVEPRFIPSLSMYPNFDIGDQLTVDKISKRWREYQRRDVVVFNPPPRFNDVVGGDRSGDALIKRIVAVAGDTVEIKNGGTLYLNGEAQDEPFTNEAARYDFGPVTVPEGCVLVLGDNRNQSLDGHVWGFLPLENIIGRATFKFWPPWHIGTITAADRKSVV